MKKHVKHGVRSVRVDHRATSSHYTVEIGGNLLDGIGRSAISVLGNSTRKVAIVSNKKVFGLYGSQVEKSLKRAGSETSVWLMGDGERFKNLRSLETALAFFSESKLTRTDAVIALGGGVVGDLTGFAAAVYLRGIRFLQVPTTLLSMIDSSVGGKTGVNSSFGKNLIGSFHRPSGVFVDIETLRTLPKRELTAGFCEAVKQAAIAGPKLFDKTAKVLTSNRLDGDDLSGLIKEQIAFKASIVAGDETEEVNRTDARSRKILNFGHTLAHALEKVTNYRYFKHGEAVGWGILFAANLSKKLEILDQHELKLLCDVVRMAGPLPAIDNIDPQKIVEAFQFDKKVVGRQPQWILLEGIGKPVIVPGEQIPISAIKQALRTISK
ncbi:MAG TPA: 3-dehydroquinate synthase [Pyrinomonadaceae bacterium]|nr:3-dehydroquinate synthase [Pyrinomonadaceae bacterium]